MSLRRDSGSVKSRQPRLISVLNCCRLAAEGVIRLNPPRPPGFGKIFPSISQKALRSPYSVSSGTDIKTGLRLYISRSNSSHMCSDSEMCVSASTTRFVAFVMGGLLVGWNEWTNLPAVTPLNCRYASQLPSELSRLCACLITEGRRGHYMFWYQLPGWYSSRLGRRKFVAPANPPKDGSASGRSGKPRIRKPLDSIFTGMTRCVQIICSAG